MLIRTHLALIVLAILLFVSHVESQFLFIGVALLATLIPDIDMAFSKLGSWKIFRFLQFFVKHRGIFHSLSLGAVLTIILSIFWPVVAFGFFLGYSVHLLGDSFTKEGIEPFWPWNKRSRGFLKTGGYSETVLFIFLIIIDLIVLIFLYFV